MTRACNFCGDPVGFSTLAVDTAELRAGRIFRYVQGDRSLSGQLGRIVRPFGTGFPGLYITVVVEAGYETRTRWDHLMFEDWLQTNKCYRELYERRLECDRFEYKEFHPMLQVDGKVQDPLEQIQQLMFLRSSDATQESDQFYLRLLSALNDVVVERGRQNLKWTDGLFGHQLHNIGTWTNILAEESGESSKAGLEWVFGRSERSVANLAHLREELIQTAAVAVQIVERIDANNGELLKPERVKEWEV